MATIRRSMLLLAALAVAPSGLEGQRSDSARAGVGSPVASPAAAERRDAPSPRRAFLGSLLLPGSMQLRFKRPKAATIFLLAEAGALGMSAKSWNDLSEAKKARADTVGTPVLNGDGTPQLDPVRRSP